MTNLAEYLENFSDAPIKDYLRREGTIDNRIGDNVKHLLPRNEQAYLIYEHIVLDKKSAKKIELTRQ